MRFSEQRISHLAHLIRDGLWQDDLLDYEDETRALNVLKQTLTRLLGIEEQVDGVVRDKLQKQNKVPGSREWQILYEKYFHEEMEKRS